MSRTEQKLRETVSNSQHRFQHEGSHVIRLLSGGTLPDAYATFERQGESIIARCPQCRQVFGRFNAQYGGQTSKQIAAIREVGSRHRC